MISQRLIKGNSKYGYYFIIIAAALSALVHVISKPMLENSENMMQINPIVMAFLVYFIAGIFFTPLSKKTHSISKFGKKDWAFMGLIGISEVAALITYFYGLADTSAVNASIFSNSEIIFALVIAMLVFKERLHIKECIPFTMIVVGMMVIPIGNDLAQNNFAMSEMVTGDLLILLSGVLYAIDITLCKYIGDRFNPCRVIQVVLFICAAVTISLIVAFEIPMDVNLMQLPGIIAISILGTVLGESITTLDGISLALVIGGIYLLRKKIAASEGHEEENSEEINPKAKPNHSKSKKRAKFTPKISFQKRVEDKVIFQSWIGADSNFHLFLKKKTSILKILFLNNFLKFLDFSGTKILEM